ncbi:MAG: biotin/lipoate A/B protein ligase family protein [Candidatus Nanoarchaeia archaeon]
MKWRVVNVGEYDAAMNMAIDEAVAEAVKEDQVLPTVRFYTWKPSAVSIGYFQRLHGEVDVSKCKEEGVDVVRRRTGGGAVYHDKEITYSVIGKEDLFPKGITESYHVICGWIIDGLKYLGLEGEFHPVNDVLVGGRKISGNAQTRRGGVLLQHGTILFDLDVDKMFSLLKVDDVKIKDKIIKNVKERVTSVTGLCESDFIELKDAMLHGFTLGKEFEFGELTSEELKRAEELAEERYRNKEWLEQR